MPKGQRDLGSSRVAGRPDQRQDGRQHPTAEASSRQSLIQPGPSGCSHSAAGGDRANHKHQYREQ